ncbi:hypothetical protein D6C78_11053, partial [Aureobasidium pullulans]
LATSKLTHLTSSSEAHIVNVGRKQSSCRIAIAKAFPLGLIIENCNKKGNILGTARIAGLMVAKRALELIPLCHLIAISKAKVNLLLVDRCKQDLLHYSIEDYGHAEIEARVECTSLTGVEMEAITAALVAALTIYDMCKAVDKGMVIS